MKQFIVLALLFTSCSTSAVRESANSVSVQPLLTPNVTTEDRQDSRGSLPILSNVRSISFPSPEKFDFKWEDIYFEEIIEREKISNLKKLKSKVLSEDDVEIRLWSGFGITLLRGFIFKRTSGEWSAINLGWEVSENRQGKRDVKPVDTELDAPKSGWNAAWQKLVDNGVLSLPDAEKINCKGGGIDGMSYIVEYKVKNTYRTYLYENPNHANCDEAKRMLEINKIIAEEFYSGN